MEVSFSLAIIIGGKTIFNLAKQKKYDDLSPETKKKSKFIKNYNMLCTICRDYGINIAALSGHTKRLENYQ